MINFSFTQNFESADFENTDFENTIKILAPNIFLSVLRQDDDVAFS